MGLDNGYKPYKDTYQDNGEEFTVKPAETPFSPDFRARNTIQKWDIINSPADIDVAAWVGTTLISRSLHEITIVNNSGIKKTLTFGSSYDMPEFQGCTEGTKVEIGAGGTAYFIGTGIGVEENLKLALRTGSLDDRKI